jgi:archaellum biogenesis ATPase FlaH
MGGGFERGTSALLVGAPGTGKSSLAARYVAAAAERGERSTMFIFDENRHVLLTRVAGMGFDLEGHVKSGLVDIQPIDPAELSPGEFAHGIRRAASVPNTALVVIDSLNGFLNAMPGEKHLALHLHEILSYLGQRGIATIMIGAHQGFVGGAMVTPVDASYLADAVLLLRYFEFHGEVRQHFPATVQKLNNFLQRHPRLAAAISLESMQKDGFGGTRLVGLLDEKRYRRVLARMLDENEFFSPYGIRSMSRYHLDHPYVFSAGGEEFKVQYVPAESDVGTFGGNSNWRGPIWFPVNFAIIEALQRTRDRECEQQTHQSEYCTLDGRQPSDAFGAAPLAVPQAVVAEQSDRQRCGRILHPPHAFGKSRQE